jgi:hypothetical protein
LEYLERVEVIMRTWFKRQWDEIKGNAKFYCVMMILSGTWAVITLVIRGLLWWQQAIVGICFSAVFAWAAIATWILPHRGQIESSDTPQSAAPLSLPQRTFALCRELQEFVDKSGPEPNVDQSWHTSDGPIVWAERWRNEVEPWRTRFSATYWLRFEKRIENTRHEFAELGMKDDELEHAIAELQKEPGAKSVKLAKEHLSILAGKLEASSAI